MNFQRFSANFVVCSTFAIGIVACARGCSDPSASTQTDVAAPDASAESGEANEAGPDTFIAFSDADDTGVPEVMLPDAGPRCIGSWPVDLGSKPEASLAASPGIAFETKTGAAGGQLRVAMAGDRLALATGNLLWLMDRQGNVVSMIPPLDPYAQLGSAPMADADGNFLFATSLVQSFDPQGEERWRFGLGKNLDSAKGSTYANQMVLSPAGIVYMAASDGYLYEFTASDGVVLQKKKIGLGTGAVPFSTTSGIGDTVFISSGIEFMEYDVSSGGLTLPPTISGAYASASPLSYSLLMSGRYEEVDGWPQGRGWALDRCHNVQWTLPNTDGNWLFTLVGYNDEILAVRTTYDQSVFGYVFAKDGSLVRGPVQIRGFPAVLGADQVFYTWSCTGTGGETEREFSVVAFDWQLQELWSLDVGKGCSTQPGILSEDGMLYFSRRTADAVLFSAIQTRSPGLAKTARPAQQFNAARTGWLN